MWNGLDVSMYNYMQCVGYMIPAWTLDATIRLPTEKGNLTQMTYSLHVSKLFLQKHSSEAFSPIKHKLLVFIY